MTTIGSVVSRIRGQIKAEVQDAFITDRYVYSLIQKFAQLLIRRQDSADKLKKFNAIWKTLPFIELIEVDKVEAECTGIQSGCTIKRTKNKLPNMMEGYWGPSIRTVSSIDGSKELKAIHPGTYTSLTKTTSFRYNNQKYFWYLNGYLYFPDLEWDAIKLEGVFDDDISDWLCDSKDKCTPRYEHDLNIPEALLAEIEQQVLGVMANALRIPAEDSDNKLNLHR